MKARSKNLRALTKSLIEQGQDITSFVVKCSKDEARQRTIVEDSFRPNQPST